MKVYSDIATVKLDAINQKKFCAIGVFDGVHLGHQRIISTLVRQAKSADAVSCVITFANHPLEILAPPYAPGLIMPPQKRVKILKELGVDVVVPLVFSRMLADIEPEPFLREIVFERWGISKLFCGFNFRFGKDGNGDTALLKKLSKKFHIPVQIISRVLKRDLEVSSTKIRELLDDGMVRLAAELLTRPLTLSGKVKKGVGRGTALGFPTANIEPEKNVLVPASGVYAVRVAFSGKTYNGMMNIGRSPTFDDAGFGLETHLFNYKGSLFGKRIHIHFIERLRDEKKFKSAGALISQLEKDEVETRKVLKVSTEV